MKERKSNTYKFTILGKPIPWNRPGSSKFGRYDTQKDIKRDFGLIFRCGMEKDQPLKGKIKLVIIFFMPIPKGSSKMRDGEWHTKKPDLDNCVKLILDSMNGIVFEDDSQVCMLIAMKGYGEVPRTEITIFEEFDEGSISINLPENYSGFA